jgi:integrase
MNVPKTLAKTPHFGKLRLVMPRPRKLDLADPKWPKIRRRLRSDGTASYVVDSGVPINGARIRKSFLTREAAESHAAHLRVAFANSGSSAFKLTDDQRADAAAALSALAEGDCGTLTLKTAVDFYLRHHRPPSGDITLERLREAFLDNRRQAGLRPRSMQDLEGRTQQFTRAIGGTTNVKDITAKQVAAFIYRPGISGQTAKNDAVVLHSLFQFAKHPRHFRGRTTPKTAPLTGWLASNPLDDIPHPSARTEQAPCLIDLDAAVRLLRAAYAERDTARLLPYVVLGLFAGLRPSEILTLDWNDLEVTGDHPVVNIRRSKTRAGIRNVDLSPLACAWLALCPGQSGPVVPPKNFRRRWARVLATAAINDWPQDCLRHTAASVHYRLYQSAPATAAMLGHSRAEGVLFGHYRAAMGLGLAKKFADLTPATVLPELADKIVPILTSPTPAKSAISKPRSATA